MKLQSKNPRRSTPTLEANGKKFAVVVSRFNEPITSKLLQGALSCLREKGGTEPEVYWCPGAFEIPFVCQTIIEAKSYDAVIVLGAVIRGETPHFDYVCEGVTQGVLRVMLDTKTPIAFGVLTTDTVEQAKARSQVDGENKGVDAALTAIEMANLNPKSK